MAGVYAKNDWWRWQREADTAAAAYVQTQGSRSSALATCLYGGTFSPLEYLGGGTSQGRQPRGVAITGAEATSGRRGFLHLDESGALKFTINGIIDKDRNRRVLDWHFAVSATVYIVGMFDQIRQKSGQHGQLDVGVRLDRLNGVVPTPTSADFFRWDSVTTYNASDYQRTARITVPEMDGDLTTAMDRLWGPLLRSVGLGDRLAVS
ncbi:hypothetical protein CcI49_02910 [Frankia sp. CcI49]|nr:hypothetical protein CcI49_02910 [Frankia sp. CcI49]